MNGLYVIYVVPTVKYSWLHYEWQMVAFICHSLWLKLKGVLIVSTDH